MVLLIILFGANVFAYTGEVVASFKNPGNYATGLTDKSINACA